MTGLHSSVLASVLAGRFGIVAGSVEPQPGGQDHRAAVLRVREVGSERQWLVKTRRAGPRTRVAARTMAFLQGAGVRHVVAPRSPSGDEPWVEIDGLSVTVFPFLVGRQAAETGLSADQWRELGSFTHSLHGLQLPGEVRRHLRRDAYRPGELALAERIDQRVATGGERGAAGREVVALWNGHRRAIAGLLDRTRVLGARMRLLRLPRVLTHGDLHTYNVLIDPDAQLWVVDWDEVMLAPRERDLMFFVGGISEELVGADATAAFLEGYQGSVDPIPLAYYRHAWAVQDIVGYAARVLLGRGLSEARRDEAARIMGGLFRPGEIVDLAQRSLANVGP